MSETNPGPSESSVALDEVLQEDGVESRAIAERFHRTMLWRLRTGRRSPDLKTAGELQELSAGRVDALGWLKPVRLRRARRAS